MYSRNRCQLYSDRWFWWFEIMYSWRGRQLHTNIYSSNVSPSSSTISPGQGQGSTATPTSPPGGSNPSTTPSQTPGTTVPPGGESPPGSAPPSGSGGSTNNPSPSSPFGGGRSGARTWPTFYNTIDQRQFYYLHTWVW